MISWNITNNDIFGFFFVYSVFKIHVNVTETENHKQNHKEIQRIKLVASQEKLCNSSFSFKTNDCIFMLVDPNASRILFEYKLKVC